MSNKQSEHSAGALIVNHYTPRRFEGSAHPKTRATKQRREYLLLHYEAGHWDFPKGHLEEGETEEDAARREIHEEAGIKVVRFRPGFKQHTAFWFWSYPKTPGEKSKRTKKVVTFFLAETDQRNVTLSHEHTGYVWLAYKDAAKLVTYDNARDLLGQAEQHFRRAESGQGGQSNPRTRQNRRRRRNRSPSRPQPPKRPPPRR